MVLAAVEWTDFLSVGALVFTVASFWWIYLRRGPLKVTTPDTYASAVTESQLRLRFPLVIFNTGAATVVVENLRLVVEGQELEWITLRRSLRPTSKDVLDFAAPFTIEGRKARELFAEFGEAAPSWRPDLGCSYPMRIERKVGAQWKPLLEFDWWAPQNDLEAYTAHRNTPPEELRLAPGEGEDLRPSRQTVARRRADAPSPTPRRRSQAGDD